MNPLMDSRYDGIVGRWWEVAGWAWLEEVSYRGCVFEGFGLLCPLPLTLLTSWLLKVEQLCSAMFLVYDAFSLPQT
jgi:hypothetical protein